MILIAAVYTATAICPPNTARNEFMKNINPENIINSNVVGRETFKISIMIFGLKLNFL